MMPLLETDLLTEEAAHDLSKRQVLERLTREVTGHAAQRAWMVLWSVEGVSVQQIFWLFHYKPKSAGKRLRR